MMLFLHIGNDEYYTEQKTTTDENLSEGSTGIVHEFEYRYAKFHLMTLKLHGT